MVCCDSKLHAACPYIEWSCDINCKLNQTVPDLLAITSGLKAGQGICGILLDSWYSAEALYSPRLWLQRFSEDVCSGVQQWQDWLVTETCSCDCPRCGCSLRATAFKRQISCQMYFVWPRAWNIKYQEIALWGLCLVISAVIESAHREFFVLSSWTHPAHLRRISGSNTVSSCKHEMWTERSNLLYAPEQDWFIL